MKYPISSGLALVDPIYVLGPDTADIDAIDGFINDKTTLEGVLGDEDDTLNLTLADLLAMCDPRADYDWKPKR